MTWALLLLFGAAALAQEQTGSVQGTVTDSITHLPVRKARVTLIPQGPMRMARPPAVPRPGASGGTAMVKSEQPQFPTATTDGSGTFALTGLTRGTYGVSVEHSSYPARVGMRPQTTTVEVGAGTEPAHLSLVLTPGATITGRIVDEDGDPVEGCYVQPIAPPSRGRNQFVGALGSDSSNEQGIYRVYGVPAGKTMVFANCPRPVFQPRPLSPNTAPPPPPTLAYVPQFYPGVTEIASAQEIELTAGGVREGIHFRMTPARVYTVKGTIRMLPGATRPERGANYVTVMKRGPADDMMSRMGQRAGGIDWSKGTFEIQSVAPGSYTVTAVGTGAQADVDVIDRPAEVVLDIRPPIELKGTIVVDGETTTPISRFTLQFYPEDRMGGGFGGFSPKDDGSFTAVGLNAARYVLRVFPQEVFVKSVTVGGQESPGGVVDLRSGASEVRVMLSTKTGAIAGTAPAGGMIEFMRTDDLMFGSRVMAADPQGAFKMGQLAPGKYTVRLEGSAGEAQEVTVGEGETVNVELKAPAAQ